MRPDPQAYADVLVLALKSALAPVLATLQAQATTIAELQQRLLDDSLPKELGALRERVAVVEVKAMQPGPPGEPGKDGKDGADGLPGLEWAGIYKDDRTYYRGQIAKWGGSAYVALKETAGVKPDAMPQRSLGLDGSVEYRGVSGKDFWELFVSKGDPGKAAK